MPKGRQTANGAPPAKAPKSAPAKAAVPKKPRTTKSRRRSPFELVNEMKAKRDALAESLSARVAKLDLRIAELELKHQARIAVSELVESRSADELAQDEAQLKAQLSIMKKARKLSVAK